MKLGKKSKELCRLDSELWKSSSKKQYAKKKMKDYIMQSSLLDKECEPLLNFEIDLLNNDWFIVETSCLDDLNPRIYEKEGTKIYINKELNLMTYNDGEFIISRTVPHYGIMISKNNVIKFEITSKTTLDNYEDFRWQ